jgi:uncharacterized protein (DUF983 family)
MAEWTSPSSERPARNVFGALVRGFLCRCPNCGKGSLFRGYLKPKLACTVCGEDLSHQRADDAPPYFTMVLVGHLVVPVMLAVSLSVDWSTTTHLALWLPLTLALTLALLRPVKGATIALQWALYMHGFDGSSDPDAPAYGWRGDGI